MGEKEDRTDSNAEWDRFVLHNWETPTHEGAFYWACTRVFLKTVYLCPKSWIIYLWAIHLWLNCERKRRNVLHKSCFLLSLTSGMWTIQRHSLWWLFKTNTGGKPATAMHCLIHKWRTQLESSLPHFSLQGWMHTKKFTGTGDVTQLVQGLSIM